MAKTQYLREKDEEVINSLSHAVALGLFIAGTIALTLRSWDIDPVWGVACLVYGLGQSLTYMFSTVYHIVSDPVSKKRWRLYDHISIYIAIASTYTPLFVIGVPSPYSYILIACVWIMAAYGIRYKYHNIGKNEFFSVALYLFLGWVGMSIFWIWDTQALTSSFDLIVLGGLVYTVGTIFYYSDYKVYFHTIWHIFVIAASIIHFYAIWKYFLIPA